MRSPGTEEKKAGGGKHPVQCVKKRGQVQGIKAPLRYPKKVVDYPQCKAETDRKGGFNKLVGRRNIHILITAYYLNSRAQKPPFSRCLAS